MDKELQTILWECDGIGGGHDEYQSMLLLKLSLAADEITTADSLFEFQGYDISVRDLAAMIHAFNARGGMIVTADSKTASVSNAVAVMSTLDLHVSLNRQSINIRAWVKPLDEKIANLIDSGWCKMQFLISWTVEGLDAKSKPFISEATLRLKPNP